jgi:hypothetical protein
VIHWFLKASGVFLLEVTVFKAKQLKGKLIFSYEEDEYVAIFILDCFEQMLRRT